MAGNETPFLAGEGMLWIQPFGPNTAPQPLGCHMLGDVTEPLGDVTLLRCRDLSAPNRWRFVGSYQDPPDLVTTTIETDVYKTAEYLETVQCPVAIFVHQTKCGHLGVFPNYERSFILGKSFVTQRSYSNLVAKDSQERASQSADVSAEPPLLRVFEMKATRISTSETRPANDIVVCGEDRCFAGCGEATQAADSFAFTTDAAAGSASGTANVDYTVDGGSNIQPITTDPFGTSENAGAGVCFRTERNIRRLLVARATTDGAAPAEVAYADYNETTKLWSGWTSVAVGAVVGEYIPGLKAVFGLDQYHLWAATSGGRIYFSGDAGSSWTLQENAVIHAGIYQAIHFANENDGFAVGAADIIAKSSDGGVTWSGGGTTGTGATINTVSYSGLQWWVGTANGQYFYSSDEGVTWNRRTGMSGDGVGQVRAIAWLKDSHGFVGFAAHNTAAPVGVILYTIDGGFTWRTVTGMPTNAGFNSLAVLATNLVYVAGETSGGTAFIAKIVPS